MLGQGGIFPHTDMNAVHGLSCRDVGRREACKRSRMCRVRRRLLLHDAGGDYNRSVSSVFEWDVFGQRARPAGELLALAEVYSLHILCFSATHSIPS